MVVLRIASLSILQTCVLILAPASKSSKVLLLDKRKHISITGRSVFSQWYFCGSIRGRLVLSFRLHALDSRCDTSSRTSTIAQTAKSVLMSSLQHIVVSSEVDG